ncbi:MAG: exodeoxyribonuclease VII large subunit [Clostridia bacterium]|nr:exodeoxyribonuclease VII large subunit [Clostridia bacterium]MBR0088628.1 exodeoxyribonuclease VII large subunit [Clostridia bacterium]
MEARVATVSQINAYVKKILDHNIILNNVWVKGEISNFKHHYSGHIYITLKDEGGLLKAVMFRSAASTLAFEPSDGMKVRARGRVSVYEAGGSYQLYIEEMIPEGVGELYIAYEQLKKQLEEEGLFDSRYKKPIPEYPKAVGVVTASTGAAVRDIINVITRRYPLSEIILYPAKVQGKGAAESVVKAIEYFNATKEVDTLIVGRGGGSIEDLWAFNEEITARAIFKSEIPIISAVGHETDFTIADFVADLRAPTPSAAAEIAVPSALELKSRIMAGQSRIQNNILGRIEGGRLLLNRFKMRTPKDRIDEYNLRVDSLVRSMENSVKMKTLALRRSFAAEAAKLDALSPLQTLSRGYSIPTKEDGTVIRSAKEMKSGDEFVLRMKDGQTDCIVK